MFTYRDIKTEDLSVISRMYVETFNAHPWNDEWTEETAGKRLSQMLKPEESYGICAYENGELCAMILGCSEQFYNGLIFEIKEFCVRNNVRGKGIGSAIYGEFEKRLREKGIKSVKLFTLRGEATEHFYEKHGFETDEEMIWMNKTLR